MARSMRIGGTSVRITSLLVFLGLSYATMLVGSLFTRIDSWYEALAKPSWTPPGWLIGAIWTLLYTLLGVASALAWAGPQDRVRRPMFAVLLGANLPLNAAWSLLFFTRHEIAGAAVEIIVLALSTTALAAAAYRRNRTAGILLLPYAAWVFFAAFLNFTIWRLNP